MNNKIIEEDEKDFPSVTKKKLLIEEDFPFATEKDLQILFNKDIENTFTKNFLDNNKAYIEILQDILLSKSDKNLNEQYSRLAQFDADLKKSGFNKNQKDVFYSTILNTNVTTKKGDEVSMQDLILNKIFDNKTKLINQYKSNKLVPDGLKYDIQKLEDFNKHLIKIRTKTVVRPLRKFAPVLIPFLMNPLQFREFNKLYQEKQNLIQQLKNNPNNATLQQQIDTNKQKRKEIKLSWVNKIKHVLVHKIPELFNKITQSIHQGAKHTKQLFTKWMDEIKQFLVEQKETLQNKINVTLLKNKISKMIKYADTHMTSASKIVDKRMDLFQKIEHDRNQNLADLKNLTDSGKVKDQFQKNLDSLLNRVKALKESFQIDLILLKDQLARGAKFTNIQNQTNNLIETFKTNVKKTIKELINKKQEKLTLKQKSKKPNEKGMSLS